jgi:phosphoenolpyruvate carboxykinase (ATP)
LIQAGGCDDDHPGSKKVTIPYSSAIVPGIVEGTIEWTEDPDSGHEVAIAMPGVDDIEILPPRRLYARQDRTDEHAAMAARPKRERKEFLNSFPPRDESLVTWLG